MSRSATILVVEDDPVVLQLVTMILSASNLYEVLAAGSALDGLRTGREFPHPIDLLLADVVMPGMLGTEVAAKLKEERPAMRVILMSGKPEGEIMVLQEGWQFLPKPFVGPALLERVRLELETRPV